ncbi:MAG: hypothetical protein AAB295_00050, partial [Chloroflexota bacterium]
ARLYSGTYGTLAALVEVSLKLVAIDERSQTFRLRGTAADLARVGAAVRALPLDGLALVTHGETALYVRAAGIAAVVTRLARELRGHGTFEEGDAAVWPSLMSGAPAAGTVARLSIPPGREAEHIDGGGIAYLGTGIAFRLDATIDDLRRLRARCEDAGGALVLERASDADRRMLGTWGRLRTPAGVARALKERFDPHGVLAPGRMPG